MGNYENGHDLTQSSQPRIGKGRLYEHTENTNHKGKICAFNYIIKVSEKNERRYKYN